MKIASVNDHEEKMAYDSAAVRVNAVLQSFRDSGSADVIDSACHFVVPILEKLNGNVINAHLLSIAIQKTYGWTVTESVCSVFLDRLHSAGHVQLASNNDDGRYRIKVKTAIAESVESDLKGIVEHAVVKLRDFPLLREEPSLRDLSPSALEDLLISFLVSLESLGKAPYHAIDAYDKSDELAVTTASLSSIVDQRPSEAQKYVFSSFVNSVAISEPALMEGLSVIVSAGMLMDLIEDFRKPTAVATLSSTVFYLDAAVVMALIGLNGRRLQAEAELIVNSLKGVGCSIAVFSVTCSEISRVIKSFLSTPKADRYGKLRTALAAGETSEPYIEAVLRDVSEAIKRFGVEVRDYQLNQYTSTHKYFDEARNDDVYSFLAWINSDAREHDAFSVTAIMRLRQGKSNSDMLRVSHAMIATNDAFVRKSREYCIVSRLLREDHCGPVVGLRDAATVAWLRTGFAGAEAVPKTRMLAACERVLAINKDILRAAREKVAEFSPNKLSEFEILLSDNRAVGYLMDVSRGVPANFRDEDAESLLSGMMESAIKIHTEDSERKLAEKDAALEDFRRQAEKDREKLSLELTEISAASAAATRDLSSKLEGIREAEKRREAELNRLKSLEIRQVEIAAISANRAMAWAERCVVGLSIALAILAFVAAILGSSSIALLIPSGLLGIFGAISLRSGIQRKPIPLVATRISQIGWSIFYSRTRSFGLDDEYARGFIEIKDGDFKLQREKLL